MTPTTTTIAAFHIGRGGQFWNAGHVSFLDLKPISYYTNDLFLTYENESAISKAIAGRDNLEVLFYQATERGPKSEQARERLSALGFEFGELIYTDGGGYPVGLTAAEAEAGIGRIEIDHDYNTNYSCYLHDCNEKEALLVLEAAEKWLYLDENDRAILKEIAGIEEEEEID